MTTTGRRLLGIVTIALAAGLLVAGCATATPGPAAATAPGPPPRLRILLTNDDGWNAPGITAVREALVRAGHQVTEVAPLTNQSGTGASVTLSGNLGVTHPNGDPTIWAVDGRPADATLVGLRAVLAGNPPDLVVSGSNADVNSSVAAIHSGTVGAAETAAEYGVPSLAISTGIAVRNAAQPPEFVATSEFLVRAVDALSAGHAPGTPVLRPGSLLNINYPRTAPGQHARAVTAVPESNASSLVLNYRPNPDGTVAVSTDSAPNGPDPNTDVAALARGEVSISDLQVNPDHAVPDTGLARTLAAQLAP